MRPSQNPNRAEWGFVALLLALCAVLTGLQYRWTGELARAESSQLRANLADSAQQLCRAFDVELAESAAQLLPGAPEIESRGREAAHLARFKAWESKKPRPIFSRVAIAERAGRDVRLLELKPGATAPAPMEWPPDWTKLREDFTRRMNSPGGPHFISHTGAILEFPAFEGPRGPGGQGGPGGPNSGWLILELDLEYARRVWLPELVTRYLSAGDAALDDIIVTSVRPPVSVIYSMMNEAPVSRKPSVTVKFNRAGRNGEEGNGPPESSRWILEVFSAPGALEAAVAASRRRNFTLALALNTLILAAGCLLVRHTRRSRQLAQAQMNFVANVSHELRTPLTVIRGAAHNLKRGVVQDPAKVEQYSGLIIQNAEQLGAMVEQVLAFTEIQRNSFVGARQPVSIAGVLRESIAASDADVVAAHCAYEIALPSGLPPVQGDAAALRRVFQNLITNAAKHAGGGNWIGVSARLLENNGRSRIEVRIADRGPGIPPAEQPKIFKPFFRGAAAQESQTRGSGLGLSLAREIVEAHEGEISVESNTGLGATFIVRIPVITTQS